MKLIIVNTKDDVNKFLNYAKTSDKYDLPDIKIELRFCVKNRVMRISAKGFPVLNLLPATRKVNKSLKHAVTELEKDLTEHYRDIFERASNNASQNPVNEGTLQSM